MSSPNNISPIRTTVESVEQPIITDSYIQQAPLVTEVKQEEIIQPVSEPLLKTEQETFIPQEPLTTPQEPVPNNTTPSIPTERISSPDDTTPAFFETTLDGLASISSKINPIAQKFGKGVGRLRQVSHQTIIIIFFSLLKNYIINLLLFFS